MSCTKSALQPKIPRRQRQSLIDCHNLINWYACTNRMHTTNASNDNEIKISLIHFNVSGTNLFSILFATICSARYCGMHKDGLIKFGDGVCTKLSTMHIARSKGDFGECSQGDVIYAYINQPYGYVERCQFGVEHQQQKL